MVGNLCRDPKLVAKYTTLHDLYLKDSLKPLSNFDRPPVKHVMMVYGVDMPSEVGYSYLIPEGKISDTSSALDPILDEIYMEEPCESEQKELSSNNDNNSDSSKNGFSDENKNSVNDMAISKIDIGENMALEDISRAIEPLQRQQSNLLMEGDFMNQPSKGVTGENNQELSTKPSSFERPLTTTSWDGVTVTEPEIEDDSNFNGTSSFSMLHFSESVTSTLSVLGTMLKENVISGAFMLFNHGLSLNSNSSNNDNDINGNEECNNLYSTEIQENVALIKSESSGSKNSKYRVNNDGTTSKENCKSYIYAVKNKDPYQKVSATKLFIAFGS